MPKKLTPHQRRLYWRGLKCLTRRAATLKKPITLPMCYNLKRLIRNGDLDGSRIAEWERQTR